MGGNSRHRVRVGGHRYAPTVNQIIIITIIIIAITLIAITLIAITLIATTNAIVGTAVAIAASSDIRFTCR